MTENTLNALRKDINEIDSDLMVLLAKRRRISHSVLEYKIANNKPVRDEEREQALLEKLINYGKSLGLDAFYVNSVFQTILEDSVLNQQALLQKSLNPDSLSDTHRVAYLGEGRVLAIEPIDQLVKNPDPAIHAFFNGPRGIIAQVGHSQGDSARG